eukprot:9483226-Alexandrium_andersonii.AAC.1
MVCQPASVYVFVLVFVSVRVRVSVIFSSLHTNVLQTCAVPRAPESAWDSANMPALSVRACQSALRGGMLSNLQ